MTRRSNEMDQGLQDLSRLSGIRGSVGIVAISLIIGCGTTELKYDPVAHTVCSADGSQLLHLIISQGSDYVRLRQKSGVDCECISTLEPFRDYAMEDRGELCCVDEEGNFYMDAHAAYVIENLTIEDASPIPLEIAPTSAWDHEERGDHDKKIQ
jgi:hypothetical protein